MERNVGQPGESWEPHAVRVGVLQAQSLVEGFVRDFTGEGFRTELAQVMSEVDPSERLRADDPSRVDALLFGAAILGAAGLALAAEVGHMTRAEVRAMAGQVVDTWLDSSFG